MVEVAPRREVAGVCQPPALVPLQEPGPNFASSPENLPHRVSAVQHTHRVSAVQHTARKRLIGTPAQHMVLIGSKAKPLLCDTAAQTSTSSRSAQCGNGDMICVFIYCGLMSTLARRRSKLWGSTT
uniref:Uncharacterized protein n=1 Tax=Octactis speculum TaxID=3111310 RepID=A0A6U3RJG7_9STRA